MTLSIIITIIACGIRRRLVQQSLQFYRLRTSTMFVLMGMSMVGVATIIGFPHIYQALYQTSRTPITSSSSLHYLGYISLISIAIALIVFYRAGKQIAQHQGYFILIIGILGIGLPQLGRYPLYYFFIAAGVEEYIKYYIGLGSFKLYGSNGSDIILFGLLSGLGFACIENIVYLANSTPDIMLVSNNIARWIIGPIVHMLYSGGLAYGYWQLYRRGWKGFGIITSALVIIIIHTMYNAYLVNAGRGIIMLVLITGYGGISWMIYQCDTLYYIEKNSLKMTS